MKKRIGSLLLALLLVLLCAGGAMASGKKKTQEDDPAYQKALVYAQAWVRELWQEVAADAAEQGTPFIFTDAMGDWMADNVKLESEEDAYLT